MNGQVTCLLIGEITILGLHALVSGFDIGVALRRAASGIALVLNPLPETFLDANGVAFSLHLGGKAKPFNVDHLAHIIGVNPCIARRNIASH